MTLETNTYFKYKKIMLVIFTFNFYHNLFQHLLFCHDLFFLMLMVNILYLNIPIFRIFKFNTTCNKFKFNSYILIYSVFIT